MDMFKKQKKNKRGGEQVSFEVIKRGIVQEASCSEREVAQGQGQGYRIV